MIVARLLALVPLLLVGCLKTRAQLRGEVPDTTPQREAVSAQRKQASEGDPTPAPVPIAAAPTATTAATAAPGVAALGKPVASAAKVEDMDEQMRNLTGRLEVLENAQAQWTTVGDAVKAEYIKDKLATEQRLQTYEDAIKKLNLDVLALNEQVTALKAAPPPPPPPPPAPKDPLDAAAEMFTGKKWKDAAAAFQKYREAFPKGKSYADATYKIGVCFQELGLKDEAKSFYDEVVTKFPKSKEAKKARIRLKSLK